MIIKQQIVIDLKFGTEWQKELHGNTIPDYLEIVKHFMKYGATRSPAGKHKDNKLEYKIIQK